MSTSSKLESAPMNKDMHLKHLQIIITHLHHAIIKANVEHVLSGNNSLMDIVSQLDKVQHQVQQLYERANKGDTI